MRPLLLCFISVATLCAAGCVPSLHPLYTPDTVTFEPALLGQWTSLEDEAESITFGRMGAHSYRISGACEGGDSGCPAAEYHLVRLGDKLFLDRFPITKEEGGGSDCCCAAQTVRTHMFMRVWLEADGLRLAWLNADWFSDLVQKNPEALAHEALEDNDGEVIITASSREIQKFLRKHADDKDAFCDATVYRRTK